VEACPKHLIDMVPYSAKYLVACSSKDKGPVAMKACDNACIGCQLCAKNCPAEAITVADFLAEIDYSKCVNCGTCLEKCPKKAIIVKE
jgi:ferredoxin